MLDHQGEPANGSICWQRHGDCLYRTLWPAARRVAANRLQRHLPGEIKDIAIQGITAAYFHRPRIRTLERLQRFTTGAVDKLAISRLRAHLADKRGHLVTGSLDAMPEAAHAVSATNGTTPRMVQETADLRRVLADLQAGLHPTMRLVLAEHYGADLTQAEIARRHRLPLGTVAGYLKRGVERLRKAVQTNQLEPRLREFL